MCYLDHVNPFPHIEEAPFTGDIVQQQHAFGATEVGLCDAAEPSQSKYLLFVALNDRYNVKGLHRLYYGEPPNCSPPKRAR